MSLRSTRLVSLSLPLSGGFTTLIDAEDLPRVSGYKWYAKRGYKDIWYAMAHVPGSRESHRTFVRMHRLILSPAQGQVIDHINRNGLDNRKENLRLVTASQNHHNCGPKRGSPHGYKGIHRSDQGWLTQIISGGKRYTFGPYPTEIEAARVYDRYARYFFGAYAYLNFPIKLWSRGEPESGTLPRECPPEPPLGSTLPRGDL